MMGDNTMAIGYGDMKLNRLLDGIPKCERCHEKLTYGIDGIQSCKCDKQRTGKRINITSVLKGEETLKELMKRKQRTDA